MSGLLVKSTVIMRENLEEMARQGLRTPVLLGGAALTRAYVEEDAKAYGEAPVAYARDAFDGLALMDKVMTGTYEEPIAPPAPAARPRGAATPAHAGSRGRCPAFDPAACRARGDRLRRHELTQDVPVPAPTLLGHGRGRAGAGQGAAALPRRADALSIPLGATKSREGGPRSSCWAHGELRPVLADLVAEAEREAIFTPQAAYGYFKAAGDGNDIVLFAEDGRQGSPASPCRVRPRRAACASPTSCATSARASATCWAFRSSPSASAPPRSPGSGSRRTCATGPVRLHGLGVELAEALAEYVHARIRAELGFGHEDAHARCGCSWQGYRGSRYSFGYPACPNLADQVPLLELLGASRIGVELGEEWQLWPEQSTSAIVLHHPEARYFNI